MTALLSGPFINDGDAPSTWPVRHLDDLVALTSDAGIPRDAPTMPFVGMEHIEAERGSILAEGDPQDYASSAFIASPGQVLYGRLRPYLNKVFIPTARVYASREFIPMEPGPDIDARFLLYRLRAHDFVRFAVSLNSGDRPRVKWPQMRGFPVRLPPLPEQQRIVEILEEQLSRLDAALDSVRVVREKAAQFRRSLLHAAFRGSLTGHQPSADDLPAGWRTSTLSDALDLLIDHRGKTAAKLGGSFVASGVPVISAIHIKNRTVRYEERYRFVTEEIFEKWMPERTRSGDVLLTSEAPLGAVAVVDSDEPLVLSQRLFCLRGAEGVLLNAYLRHFLESPQGQGQLTRRSSGTTVTGIRQSELRRLSIPIPPLVEQQRIVGAVDDQLARLDGSLAVADKIEKRAAALRRSLLHAAFTGRLTEQWRERAHV